MIVWNRKGELRCMDVLSHTIVLQSLSVFVESTNELVTVDVEIWNCSVVV